jgi:glutathione synthase/RimK-type ligase-like ATP-grasp enzyme
MTTLLYHAKTNGAVCRKIAQVSEGKIEAVCDKTPDENGEFGTILVRWDSRVEAEANTTVNSAEAVRFSRNKRESREMLAAAGLAPTTWLVRSQCQFPCVVRPARHFGGLKFHLCHNQQELLRATQRYRSWYASAFIEKIAEYRVFILKDKVLKVVQRFHPTNDPTVPWNYHAGSTSKKVVREEWPQGVLKMAKKAAKELGLDWCAVDVMVDHERPWVLEANTAPGLKSEGTFKLFARHFGGLE